MATPTHNDANSSSDQLTAERFRQTSKSLALFSASLSVFILLGYALQVESMVRIIPNLPASQPNVSLIILLCASAVLLDRTREGLQSRTAQLFFGTITVLYSTITLAFHAFRVPSTILEQALWADNFLTSPLAVPNRPSIEICLSLLALGTAVIGLANPSLKRLYLGGTAVAIAMGFTAILGYIYGAERGSVIVSTIPVIGMSITTAILVISSSLAIAMARPRQGLLGVMTTSGAGAILTRKLLGVIILAPVVLVGLVAFIDRLSLSQTPLVLSLLAASQIIILSLLALTLVRAIEQFDKERRQALDDAARAKEALDEELPLVAALRLELSPELRSVAGKLNVFSRAQPATGELAGDWSALVDIDKDTKALILIDIAGHGSVPALFALKLKHMALSALRSGMSPSEVFTSLSPAFEDDPEQIATGVIARINVHTGECVYANAGHPTMFHVAKGAINRLTKTGPLLGAPVTGWEEKPFKLTSNEMLVAYTDGIIEAKNSKREEFGEDTLYNLVSRVASEGPDVVAEACLDAVLEHTKRRLDDDATVVVLAKP